MERRDFIKSVAAAGTIAAVGRRAHAAWEGLSGKLRGAGQPASKSLGQR